MSSNFDDNNLGSVEEENLRFFYEEFSASVRKQLLAKNLLAPQNVYDVLYPSTRETLLSKNVAVITDLEQNSKTIRDALIAKLVKDNVSLEKISEDTRNSLLARNKIIQDTEDLLSGSYGIRKDNLSKNNVNEGDLFKDSQDVRENNVSKNVKDLSNQVDLDSNAEQFRNNNISKNNTSSTDLLESSKDFRNNNIASNVSVNSDLEKDSQNFRNENISANKSNGGDLLNDSATILQNNISANKPNGGDLLNDSAVILKNNTSSNIANNSDLLNDSQSALQNNLAPNVPNNSDLLNDSAATLKNNLSTNKPNGGDLLNDSQSTLQNNISANKPNGSDLLDDSAVILQNNISANKPNGSDLLDDSAVILENNLSANKPNSSDLLDDSAVILENNLSANKPNSSDLLDDSATILQNNISANKPSGGDLLNDSAVILENNLSANKPNGSDLLNDSATILQNNISANKPNGSDLLNDSQSTLQNNLSANKPNGGDLLNDSQSTLQNNLSANKPNGSDLLNDSTAILENNLSANKPNGSDLLDDSQSTLQNNLSANKPNGSDLLDDSQSTLQNNLAPNVPNNSDLLNDSQSTLQNNLAPNVPSNGDLLNDSQSTLQNNLAPNIPSNSDLLNDSQSTLQSNLAPNVPNNSDLLSDSVEIRNDNLTPNVPSDSDLLNDSIVIRNNLISSNVSSSLSLDSFSKQFRDNNLAHNPPTNSLGVVVEGIGTSTFLGVSRVLVQGVLLRQVLLSKNKNSRYSIDTTAESAKNELFSKNKFQLNSNEYGTSSVNLTQSSFAGFYGKTVRQEVQGQFDSNLNYNNSIATNLQNKYGTNTKNSSLKAVVGGGFYSINSISPKGGFFEQDKAFNQVQLDIRVNPGSITDAIRNYNLSRNLYNLYKITPGDLSSLTTLQANNDEGFQDLINKTVGHLSGNDNIGSQLQGNLIPRGILVANEGAYIKGGSPETQFRPQQAQGMVIGSPESMMVKTTLGNPLNDTEFQSGAKGVMHIIRTIRNSDASKFSINYDVQNTRKYVIGVNTDGSPKIARQKFTIANPYRPGNAKKVQFYIQNYSSGQAFYFPPYIQDFSDSYGANWNSINFLGRPEPVFTYNNSTRDGSITFMVLTDYAQNLVIGTDFTQDSLNPVTINPKVHFTDQDASQNNERTLAIQQSEANQKLTNNQIAAYSDSQNNVNTNSPNKDVLNKTITGLQKDSNSMQQNQEDLSIQSNHGNLYSETNPVIGNVNNYLTSKPGREAGDIDTKAEDTKKRIDEMVRNLAFQPAFFSGDKVDFLTKMDFLAKLTRPAKADEGSGFSFTRPPVCHIHLGDWWSNDIVIDSVNFNYADAPWTLDDGRTQPMWAVVSMSFKFIGPYRGQQGGPVLSDDINGLYALRGTPSKSIK